jgi:Berberine and berberine like
MAEGVVAYLAQVTDATRPFQTGDTYVNFMELEGASAERVKAAYAPEDFERLVALKDRYGPQNVFRFNRNIALICKLMRGEQRPRGHHLVYYPRRSRCAGRWGGPRSSVEPALTPLPL